MGTGHRVLFVNPGLGLGGAEQSLLLLLQGLRRHGAEVTVALFGDGPFRERLRSLGVDTAVISVPRVVRRATRYESLGGLVAAMIGVLSLRAVLQLRALIRHVVVDLVHTNGLKAHLLGGLAGRLADRPVVWHLRDYLPRGVAGHFFMIAARWLPSLIITNSLAVARSVARHGRRPRTVVVHNPVDLERFRPGLDGSTVRQALGLGDDTPLVGQIAHLTPWKGHELFLRIASLISADLPNTRFVIVGGSIYETSGHERYRATLERRAREFGLVDRLTTLGSRDDVPEILAALDVLVHCPTSPEPFGRVLAEAMATGTPVVAANAGGIPEIVQDGATGRLVPSGDAAAFAKSVVELLRSRDLRRQMGVAGRRRAEQLFPVAAHVNAVLAAYNSI